MFIQQLDKSHGSPPRKNNSKKQNVQFHYWTVCYDWYERTFFIHSATKIRNIPESQKASKRSGPDSVTVFGPDTGARSGPDKK